MVRVLLAIAVLMPGMGGCYSVHRAATTRPAVSVEGLSGAEAMEGVEAIVSPPVGWRGELLKDTSQQIHRIWYSPSGDTAYGVIHVHLPLPFKEDLVLAGFLHEMRAAEGEGRLISRADAPELPGVRFVAEGRRYRLRANLMVEGWRAWVIYAGALRSRAENGAELRLAERAREATVIGLSGGK